VQTRQQSKFQAGEPTLTAINMISLSRVKVFILSGGSRRTSLAFRSLGHVLAAALQPNLLSLFLRHFDLKRVRGSHSN